MTVESPRFDYCVEKACELLLSSSISTLPINPYKLISDNHWGLTTYSKLASDLSTEEKTYSVFDLVQACGSSDGFTVFSNNNYCIAYNDTVKTKNRINFTLCHEIGHIVLSHFKSYSYSENCNLDEKRYKILETEANYFASNLLAPKVIIELCDIKSPQILKAATGLSVAASKTHLKLLKEQRFINNYDKQLCEKFKTYIEISQRRNATLISI